MATTVQTPATEAAKRIPMTSTRKTALVAGVFYLITFVSIPTLALYGPVKNHRDWVLSSGSHTGVLVGGFLEVIVAPFRAHRTRLTGRMAAAPMMAQSPATIYSTP